MRAVIPFHWLLIALVHSFCGDDPWRIAFCIGMAGVSDIAWILTEIRDRL